MISLGNGDKLMSLYEVLDRVRANVRNVDEMQFEFALLAIALDEPVEVIRGALTAEREEN